MVISQHRWYQNEINWVDKIGNLGFTLAPLRWSHSSHLHPFSCLISLREASYESHFRILSLLGRLIAEPVHSPPLLNCLHAYFCLDLDLALRLACLTSVRPWHGGTFAVLSNWRSCDILQQCVNCLRFSRSVTVRGECRNIFFLGPGHHKDEKGAQWQYYHFSCNCQRRISITTISMFISNILRRDDALFWSVPSCQWSSTFDFAREFMYWSVILSVIVIE
jgi:hypothetical protein